MEISNVGFTGEVASWFRKIASYIVGCCLQNIYSLLFLKKANLVLLPEDNSRKDNKMSNVNLLQQTICFLLP